MERPSTYIPMDRRQAIVHGDALPDRAQGAALFADISGFTPLTEQLVQDLGPQRGAEEITQYLNRVYDALINELHRFGGSVISFSGDAITCWLDGDNGQRATACALAMQSVMRQFSEVTLPSGGSLSLAMKAAVATGNARRFLVGNPEIQLIDVLAGATLERLITAEHQANKDEVVVDEATVAALGERIQTTVWRQDKETRERFGVVSSLEDQTVPLYWPKIPPGVLPESITRRWLLPPVYSRLKEGGGEFLAELRPAVALFLRFGGIDYDGDPDAERKLDRFIREVQRILQRYESSLLQLTIGDKGSYLYAAFGAPSAHEDDAVRAISAALELQGLVETLAFIKFIQIGISQGRMRTGAYGGTMRRTYGVLGDAVNVAARLMETAVPGQILVSEQTQQAAAGAFTWESLPAITVKGKAEPVNAYAITGQVARPAIRLQEPIYALPMVGREAEMKLIQQILAPVLHGKGQIIKLYGEAGIGKSRLIAEIIRLAGAHELLAYGGECQSYGTNTSYLVWQRIWQNFFGLDPEWSLDEQIHALGQQLANVEPNLVPRLPLLSTVLKLAILDNDLTRSFDAKLRKVSLEALLVECLRARSVERPMLLVLEDCHWLDSLSHDLLEAVSRAIADRPVLIVLAYRLPDSNRFSDDVLPNLSYYHEIKVSEFTPAETQQLIDLKLQQLFQINAKIPGPLVVKITERAAGNPFYIEELMNYLKNQVVKSTKTLQELDLPTSLHSLILSRIDQLTESQKNTIKVASVIGRLFQAATLWGAYPQLGDEHQVRLDLEVLHRLDLTPLDTPDPELTYLFKNVITQEVAYESLPYATRSMLHNLIAQYIERTSRPPGKYVDLLAFHYGRSENESKKVQYLLQAGDIAQRNYANQSAISYYRQVLPLLETVEQITVRRKLGQVLELVGDWDEAGKLYHDALTRAESLKNRQEQAWCQAAIAQLLRKQGQYAEASVWLRRARAVFEELDDKVGVAEVLHNAGTIAAQQGDFEPAKALYRESLDIRRQLDDKRDIASSLNNLAIIARFQGDLRLSRSLHEQALAIRREVGDRWAIANSLNNLGNAALDQGNYEGARVRIEEAVSLLREIGDRWAIANSLNNLGNVVRDQGDYSAARFLYEESLTMTREFDDKRAIAYLLEDMACLAALESEPERAVRLVSAASTLRQSIGAPLSDVEQTKLSEKLESSRLQLEERGQDTAVSSGHAMSLDEAIEYALNSR